MCVICHKPRGAKLPSAQIIRAMWKNNPDGAGVMWRDGRHVRYVKGFMDEDEFMQWLEASRNVLDNTECALHFRITTHGGTNMENCHPFPLDKRTSPHALAGKCKRVLMHNGVMPITPRDKKYSDTAEYALRAKESGDAGRYIKSTAEWVAQTNRLCVFLPNETLLVGKWNKRSDKEDGCNYSNLNFESFGYGYGCAWKPVMANDSGSGFEEVPYFYWSDVGKTWKTSFGKVVPIWEVDPYSLYSDSDEEEYDKQMAELDAYYDTDSWGVYCNEKEKQHV